MSQIFIIWDVALDKLVNEGADIFVSVDVQLRCILDPTQSIPSEPVLRVVSLPTESWIKIAHLNVHSYLAKHDDIIRDEAMKHANIMCFTETFLRPQQQLENNKLPMQDECMVFRLDRIQTNSDNLAKGGIMIVCHRISSQRPPQLEVVGI